ncbi:MAG: hypothetical protein HYR75_02865 [Gemmatimonadetes bacterium]|nr:hypothetical protein [Gemmatimonadota bacterium]MBI3569048.1 hypothetical protein [Gemmatimonadota bacterium]
MSVPGSAVARARLVRHDATGTHSMGTLGAGPRMLDVPLGALRGVVLELRPR